MVQQIQPLVSIIVLNWNGLKDTRDCLRSLQGVTYPNKHVIVVDNGSTDGSIEELSREFPHVEFLGLQDNTGFCEGNNIGIEYALAEPQEERRNRSVPDYVMILNNDTLVSPTFLQPLVDALQTDLDVVSPLICYADRTNTVWFAGSHIDWNSGWAYHTPANISEDDVRLQATLVADYVCGCCLIASADTWRRVGKLDERFFAYWEDVDWSVRAKELGLRLGVVGESKILHKVAQAPLAKATGTFLFLRNGLLFIDKHVHKDKLAVYSRFLTQWLLKPTLREIKMGHYSWNILGARLSGLAAHLRQKYGSPYAEKR